MDYLEKRMEILEKKRVETREDILRNRGKEGGHVVVAPGRRITYEHQ
jgi:hypothetical protein